MAKRIDIKNRATGASESHVVQQKNAVLKAKGPAAVKVEASKADVAGIERDGDDLILRFNDGTVVRLQDYFDCAGQEASQLDFVDPSGNGAWSVSLGGLTCQGVADGVAPAGNSGPIAYSFEAVGERGGMGVAPLLGLGALVLGGAAAAAGGGGGGGNKNPPAEPVDRTPPAAPTISPTNGKVIKGTAEANAKVNLDLDGNGTTDTTVQVDASGNWTYTPTTPIANGTKVTATATDAAGNTSGPSSVTVDAAAPPVPTIGSVNDDVAPVTGAVANGGATNDTRPTLSGTGTEAGATITIYDNGTQVGTTTADANGAWNFTPATALGQGAHSFTATATDALGNVSAPSPAYAVTVDTTTPGVPAIGTVTDDIALITGTVANGGSTNDTRPAISGTGAEAGATISIYDN
ncbi:MAG: Ig-like domain-containing protein, partial [Sphingobium sp.]